MSAPAFAWAFEKGPELGLTSSQLVLLLYMADQANGQGWFFTGYARMATYTRLCERTVRAVIPQLARLGLIRAEQRPGKPTIYHVLRQPQGLAAATTLATTTTPATRSTPATAATDRLATTATHKDGQGGSGQQAPRQSTALTLAVAATDPSSTQECTLKKAGQGLKDREAAKEACHTTPQPAPETPPKAPTIGATTGGGSQALIMPRPSDAWLDNPTPDDALPKARAATLDVEKADVITDDVPDPDGPPPPGAFKALIASIASGFQNNYPARLTDLTRDEQAASCQEKPRPKTYHLSPEQLRIARPQTKVPA